MGCNIHAFIEYQSKERSGWTCFARPFLPRNYGMFVVMAGVRDYGAEVEKFSPKGIPEDISVWDTLSEFTLWVNDQLGGDDYREEGHTTRKHAEHYIEKCRCRYWDKEQTRVTHPDWHSASWLSLEEFRTAYSRYRGYFKQHVFPDIEKHKFTEGETESEKKRKIDEFMAELDKHKDELEPVLPVPEVEAIIGAMEALESAGCISRLVFWFDN